MRSSAAGPARRPPSRAGEFAEHAVPPVLRLLVPSDEPGGLGAPPAQ
jgi:hypothetical protein